MPQPQPQPQPQPPRPQPQPTSWDQIQKNAFAFSKRWENATNENADAQNFLTEFFHVFGVINPAGPTGVGSFEHKVQLTENTSGWIDYLWPGTIAIEMKSRGKDLASAYDQLKKYMQHLDPADTPDLWMTCDFATIELHNRATNKTITFKTKDLHRHLRHFVTLAGYDKNDLPELLELNVKAAEKMAALHDALRLDWRECVHKSNLVYTLGARQRFLYV